MTLLGEVRLEEVLAAMEALPLVSEEEEVRSAADALEFVEGRFADPFRVAVLTIPRLLCCG
jgi:hypothetical protein